MGLELSIFKRNRMKYTERVAEARYQLRVEVDELVFREKLWVLATMKSYMYEASEPLCRVRAIMMREKALKECFLQVQGNTCSSKYLADNMMLRERLLTQYTLDCVKSTRHDQSLVDCRMNISMMSNEDCITATFNLAVAQEKVLNKLKMVDDLFSLWTYNPKQRLICGVLEELEIAHSYHRFNPTKNLRWGPFTKLIVEQERKKDTVIGKLEWISLVTELNNLYCLFDYHLIEDRINSVFGFTALDRPIRNVERDKNVPVVIEPQIESDDDMPILVID